MSILQRTSICLRQRMHEERDCYSERWVWRMYHSVFELLPPAIYHEMPRQSNKQKLISYHSVHSTLHPKKTTDRLPFSITALLTITLKQVQLLSGHGQRWDPPKLFTSEHKKTTKESHSISYSRDTGWGPAVGKANDYQDVSNSMTPLPGWKHRMTLYYVLVCLLYPSFLSSGISSTKSHEVNCQSYIHMNIFQGGNHTKQNTQLFTHDRPLCMSLDPHSVPFN